MKGYVFKEGKIFLKENVCNAIGSIKLPNGEKCDVDLPIYQAKSWFNAENARLVLEAFEYASSVPRPVQVGSFGFWLDNEGWHFTSWEEADEIQKILSVMFDKTARHAHNA